MIDFSDLNILVIGDIILDEFAYGNSNRMSPEFDAPVIDIEKKIQNLGGAGNVFNNLISLGAKSKIISVIGNDQAGQTLTSLLGNKASENLIVSKSATTTFKSRLYNNEIPVARVDYETKLILNVEEEQDLVKHIESLMDLDKPDALILQDYNKGLLTASIIKRTIEKANILGIPVFVDPKTNNYESFSGCKVFKPNYSELSQVLGYKPDINTAALDKASKKLSEYVHYDILILTLSNQGAYFSDGRQSGIISTPAVENPDVCGAGDTFISAFCLALESNFTLVDGIKFANYAAGEVCKMTGVQAPNLLKMQNFKQEG